MQGKDSHEAIERIWANSTSKEHSGAKLGGPALSSHQRENNLEPNTYIFGATHQAHITENKF